MVAVENIIFDLDGTLADTLNGIVKTFCQVLEEKGLHCPEERVTDLIRQGKSLPQLYGTILPPGPEGIVDECVGSYIPLYERNFPGDARLYDGMSEVLEELAARNYAMAIASSKRKRVVEMALERFDIGHHFRYAGGFEDVKRRKPHPDIVLEVMRKLGWNPDVTLMVGDTGADIRAGKAAGTLTCAALYGFSLPGILEELDPDLVIRRPSDLLDVL